ncbi:putative D-xylulose kinase A [Bienertia sinuspersici]
MIWSLYWRLTRVHRWAEHGQKSKTWELLRCLGSQSDMPWMLFDDFNEVLYETKKRGGNPCDLNSVQRFREVADELGLRDMGIEGYDFTWSNIREGEAFIEERLDRVLVNEDLLEVYPMVKVCNLIWDSSDHFPLVVGPKYNSQTSRIFSFEAKWLQVENFDAVVKGIREDANCGERFKVWDSTFYKGTIRKMKWLKKRLERLEKMSQTHVVVEETKQVESELRNLRRSKETAAWQRCPLIL